MENVVSRRKYVIITENINKEIMERRREKFGPEQIVIFMKGTSGEVYDVLEMINFAIGMKITENGEQFGASVGFGDYDVTDENIIKAIDYLSNLECKIPLVKGIPVQVKMVSNL